MNTACDSESPKDPISERFNATDHDVVLISNDHVVFNFYRKNIKVHSVGLLDTDTKDTNPLATSNADPSDVIDTIAVDETSKTLDLLLQFMSRQLPPSLEGLPFTDVEPLTEAVNKYGVYAALPACREFMWNTLPKHSFDILAQALRHGDRDLVDYAAPFTVAEKPQHVRKALLGLPQALVISWIQYRGAWDEIFQDACQSLLDMTLREGGCRDGHVGAGPGAVALRMKGRPGSMKDLKSIVLGTCVSRSHATWVTEYTAKINAIGKFSAYSTESTFKDTSNMPVGVPDEDKDIIL
ncbi:hypothetical protein PLICRDRAFT_335541 [Plicaturopsis crispa FD-325 SS-3]|uniref:Unplaced genomic scaffold PLICRscaffold_15, whole genome shotgun sequence n=1 Tax=Plicaturopsis crispa FD-325 SS-3 TaxID=944288 RepID=A0A0C9SYQ2_PLICR|nr:hypothetical protein PLICRDRAFT_335541 [Plicaturopsis crispa FD-325 SS-3]